VREVDHAREEDASDQEPRGVRGDASLRDAEVDGRGDLEQAGREEEEEGHGQAPDEEAAALEGWPEDLGSDEAAERIHDLLRGYESGDLLTGWVLFTTWVDEQGISHGGWVVPADLDFYRILGIVRAGVLQVEAAYMREETIDTEGDE
jgi:hypothetical protein